MNGVKRGKLGVNMGEWGKTRLTRGNHGQMFLNEVN